MIDSKTYSKLTVDARFSLTPIDASKAVSSRSLSAVLSLIVKLRPFNEYEWGIKYAERLRIE